MTSTPTAPLAELGRRFHFNLKTIQLIAEAYEPADWAVAPPGGGNTAHWILGHLAFARRGICRVLGEALPEEDWEAPFRRDASPVPGEEASYPPAETLLEDLARSGALITSILDRADAEHLDGPAGRSFPDGSDTRGGAAQFMHFHEVYHVGQLGLLRRMVGKPGFI